MGSYKRQTPDVKQQEEAEKESRDKLVKTIKWKDQQSEKNLGVEPLLYNGDGEYRQTRGRKRGRDEQTEARHNKEAMGRQDSVRQEEEVNRAIKRRGARRGPRSEGPRSRGPNKRSLGSEATPRTLDSGPDKGPRLGPDKGPW